MAAKNANELYTAPFKTESKSQRAVKKILKQQKISALVADSQTPAIIKTFIRFVQALF